MVGRGNEAVAEGWHDGGESASLRQETVQLLSYAVVCFGMVTAMVARPDGNYPFGGRFAVFLSLLPSGLIAAYLSRRRPFLAAVVIIGGLSLSWVAGLMCMFDAAVPFYGALIIVAAFLVSPRFGLASAGINVLLLGFMRPGVTGWGAILFLFLISGLAWLSLRLLHTALLWSQSSQIRAARLLADLREHQGELNGTLKMLQEATERLERVNGDLVIARQEADEARALKEQFVANVSHELRTPLNLIVGFSEMMYLDPDSYDAVHWTSELAGDVGELYRASKHLQSLVDDILDLSRIDASRLPMFREMVPIEPILNEAIETISPLLRQHGLYCRLECPAEELPKLFLDQTRIRQVMLNLLNNAVRYTERGGIRVRVQGGGDSVMVTVQDTGVGISQEQLPHLFERFRQADAGRRSASGTGLGLALCRQFVELHGGKIWAESQLGEGSSFIFRLPLPGTLVAGRSLRQPARPASRVGRNDVVAIVDRDTSLAEMLGRYLGDRHIVPLTTLLDVPAFMRRQRPQAIIVNHSPGQSDEQWLDPLGDAMGESSVPVIHCAIPSPSWVARSTGFDACLTKPITREMIRQVALGGHKQYESILIADDDTGFVNFMRRTLGVLGFPGRILTAYDGVAALRVVREQHPGLVLLDLIMPRLGGFDVAREIRAMGGSQDVCIVAVTATAYATESMVGEEGRLTIARVGGIKPGQVADLMQAILDVLGAG